MLTLGLKGLLDKPVCGPQDKHCDWWRLGLLAIVRPRSSWPPLLFAPIIMCKTQWNHVYQDKGTESSVPITEVGVIRLSLCLRQKKPS